VPVWYHRAPVASNSEPGEQTIDGLVAANRHEDAARLAMELGQYGRAAELYEKLWDFRLALEASKAAGDQPRALRYALEVDDAQAVHDLLTVMTGTEEGTRAALDLLVRLRRHAQAAPLAEQLGETDRAIDLFTRAHDEINAARLLEAAGRDREAGRLLERALDLAAEPERAKLQLALGRILARRGAYAEATRLLQEARKRAERVDLGPDNRALPDEAMSTQERANAAVRREATRHLIATLAAMGLRDGARDALLDLRKSDPEVTADLDTYLRSWRDEVTERKGSGRDKEVIAGRYRIDRLLGAGASGRVFLASDEVAGRSVAIKMFFAAGARGGTAYERFVREARLASTLRHPSLVEVYDVSVERGFLVMEYLPGGSLAQRLAAGERLSPSQVRRMALDIIGGLEAAHHRGVVHRDVKPANVFFDARGTAKLGDFGVAHLVDLGQTQTGGLIGTLAYMSPEQITGAPISIAADLYSVGVTLFEAVTGRMPFLGPDFVAQHLGEPAPLATEVSEGVNPGWDPILKSLLIKNPQDRTQTLGDLRRQIEHLDLGTKTALTSLPRRISMERPAVKVEDDARARPRYQFETPLGTTAVSQLARAVDSILDRTVIIERFESTDDATRALDRARSLGRAQSPFVQRALSYDRSAQMIIFEAPSGASLADALPVLPAAEVVRILKRLARAAVAVHEVGGTHGAIGPRTVVIDDSGVPTIMAAGLGIVADATPADDVTAIVALLSSIAGAEPSFGELAKKLCDEVDTALPAALAALSPTDGESLYAAADALDIAILSALGSR
jgi:tRNA A-37 threonylcarbamoyl transferase component Bud32/tetratricopeptide (TPR) repeat protein